MEIHSIKISLTFINLFHNGLLEDYLVSHLIAFHMGKSFLIYRLLNCYHFIYFLFQFILYSFFSNGLFNII